MLLAFLFYLVSWTHTFLPSLHHVSQLSLSFLVIVPHFKGPTAIFTLLPFLLYLCLLTHPLLSSSWSTVASFPPVPCKLMLIAAGFVKWRNDWCDMEVRFVCICMFDMAQILCQMPLLTQCSPFTRAWDQNRGCICLCLSRGWFGRIPNTKHFKYQYLIVHQYEFQ